MDPVAQIIKLFDRLLLCRNRLVNSSPQDLSMTAHYQDFYYRSADGLQLYSRIYESNSPGRERNRTLPVLCLPGLTRNCRDFAELATHLQPHYRVLTPDLRGRGRSAYDPNYQNYHPGTYLADISALLVALDIPRVVIIGTSLGALLAMLIGAQHPKSIIGMVLNDAGPEIDSAGAARIAKYVGLQAPVQSWQEAAEQAKRTYGHALPGLSDAQWLSYTRQAYRDSDDGKPIADMDANIGALFRSGAATPQDLWPVFAKLHDLPILTIRGAKSDILSAVTLQRMAQQKADLQQLTVANRGHAPLLNEPECIVAIDKFLAELTY
jgi:pimeloyl-ACP methyl ester carboxylesterase